MVTIKDIAEECNVSITTVSNVLNGKAKVGEKTKQRILEVIEKRGYRPNTIAQGLRSQKTKNIAIIADDIAQFSTPEIIEGIMSYCEQRSYRTTVRNLRLYARWQDTWYNNDAAFHSILNPILDELNSHMVDGRAIRMPCLMRRFFIIQGWYATWIGISRQVTRKLRAY